VKEGFITYLLIGLELFYMIGFCISGAKSLGSIARVLVKSLGIKAETP
jgi:hypothetical protein